MTDVARPIRPLPELLEALRSHGLRQGTDPGPMVAADPLPTGHPSLDAALRSGGWPRGALALLDAPTGGGATSLALGSLAACQAAGGLVAWLDPADRFDPATAARLGVALEWLLVVRPADPAEAVELAGWLTRTRLIDLLVLDLADAPPPRGLDRLADLLLRAGGTGLLLAGSFGRGAWTIADVSAVVDTIGMLQIYGDQVSAGEDNQIRLVHGVTGLDPLTLSIDALALVSDQASGSVSSYATATSNSSVAVDVTSASAAAPLFTQPTFNLKGQAVYTVFMLGGQSAPAGRLSRDR